MATSKELDTKAKKTTFIVQARITDGIFSFPVDAATLEEALNTARCMKCHEQLDALEEWLDYTVEITGVYK